MTTSKSDAVVRRNSKKTNQSGKAASSASAPPEASKSARYPALPILPGEDARAYRSRLKAWTGSLEPRDAVETYLVERAVILSWKLDRADRAQFAHLALIANLIEPDQASQEAGARWDGLTRDAFASGERLRRHQLAWGRELFRTLDAFSSLRRFGATGGAARNSVSAASPTAVGVDRPAGVGLPITIPLAKSREPEPVQACQVSAALIDILASAGSECAPAMSEVATTMEPPSPARLDGSLNAPAEAQDRPGSLPRRRLASRRTRQPSWSGSGGSDTTGAAPMGLRSRPVRRAEHAPDGTSNLPDARRRVGGYAVPLDPAIPVTCADRIPVRLRREASAARLARAASCPSS
jgi:hypothetical protein